MRISIVIRGCCCWDEDEDDAQVPEDDISVAGNPSVARLHLAGGVAAASPSSPVNLRIRAPLNESSMACCFLSFGCSNFIIFAHCAQLLMVHLLQVNNKDTPELVSIRFRMSPEFVPSLVLTPEDYSRLMGPRETKEVVVDGGGGIVVGRLFGAFNIG